MSTDYARPQALVSIDWLAAHLDDEEVRILDGSFYLPGSGRDPRTEYAAAHIPGARFFDIDGIRDETSPLPHMLPSAEVFACAAGALGIDADSFVIAYDQPDSFAAPRVWWTFRSFGHHRVAVLDGGLAAWMAAGLPVTDAPPRIFPASFPARFEPGSVRSAEEIAGLLGTATEQIIDARPPGRYAGGDPEPRPTAKSGHVPGAVSLPFLSLVDTGRHGAWRTAAELEAAFAAAGIDPQKPSTAYCGSGVTACSIAFGAHLLGSDAVAVYDGSWAEWGNRDDLPVVAGETPGR